MRLICLAAVALAIPSATLADGTDLRVDPAPGDRFEVRFRAGEGAGDYWCAAGIHARQRLGAAPTDRIYRLTPVPRPRGQGVVFSFDPADDVGETGLFQLGGSPGVTVADARLQCDPFTGDL